MKILMSDEEIVQEIREYPNPNWIWIDIWEVVQNTIELVISVNDKEQFKLGGHKTIIICSLKTDEEDLDDFKKIWQANNQTLKKKISRQPCA